jgi:CHAT domain-containing protein
LHIATHATWDSKIDNKDLKAGGLLFASVQNMEDVSVNERINFISAKEISTMDLSNTSLAVLSACQTGIGKITDDGVWGIQRAFKMAGVKTILMSLWKVDDIATALMMTTFYKELLATNNKHIAYKRAQQKVREKFENPYYWAGFIMLD